MVPEWRVLGAVKSKEIVVFLKSRHFVFWTLFALAVVTIFHSSVYAGYYIKYKKTGQTHFLCYRGNSYTSCTAAEVPMGVSWVLFNKNHGYIWLVPVLAAVQPDIVWTGTDPLPASNPASHSGPSTAEVAQRAEAERKAEEERKEEEARQAEAVRQTEIKRQLELGRIAQANRKAAVAEHAADLYEAQEFASSSRDSEVKTDREVRLDRLRKSVSERVSKFSDLCFTGETPISVADDSFIGYRSQSISSIRVGDLIVSCNLSVRGGTCEIGQVQKVFVSSTHLLKKLTFRGRELKATENHPFYVVNRKGWLKARDLSVGDSLLTISGEKVPIERIQEEQGTFTVYNLEVQGNHNYYACDVLVHNCNSLAAAVPAVAEVIEARGGAILVGEAAALLSPVGEAALVVGGAAYVAKQAYDRFNSPPSLVQDVQVGGTVSPIQDLRDASTSTVTVPVVLGDTSTVIVPESIGDTSTWIEVDQPTLPTQTQSSHSIPESESHVRVKTPYGEAAQEITTEALGARVKVKEGTKLYRLGTRTRSETGNDAQFWSLEHPKSEGYAERYGIPRENISNYDFIETATIRPDVPFVTRPAPPSPDGASPGGGIEVVLPKGSVRIGSHSSI